MTHQEFKTRFLPYYQKLYRLAFRYLGNECEPRIWYRMPT